MQVFGDFPLSIGALGGFLLLLLLLCLLYYYRKNEQIKALETTKHLFDVTSRITDNPWIVFGEDGTVIHVNNQMHKYIQIYMGDNLFQIEKSPKFLIEGEAKEIDELIAIYQARAIDHTLFLPDAQIITKNREYTVAIRMSDNGHDDKQHYTGMAFFDTGESLELSRIYYQNTITGLPNQNKAMADIGLLAHRYAPSKKKFAVAVISIDNFLEITSVVGYKESLQVLSFIAKYLQAISIENKLKLYHVTSNNFLLIIPDIHSAHETNILVEQYKNDCESLLHDNHSELHYTISSGISIFPNNGIENLITSAYKALLLAKKQGLGYTMIAQGDHEVSKKEAPVQFGEIKRALEEKEFELYYQPLYDNKKEEITGAEALIRWIHPVKGVIPPGLFLPLVEKTGFMKQLGEFVANEAIEQLAIWRKLGFREIQVSINLSLREFEVMDYPHLLDTILHRHMVNTSQLKVEVTENIAMANEKFSAMQFAKLKKLGIDISLDDFGTGYSSFSMLEAFPIHTLKIDRSFVGDMHKNKEHHTIVTAMIAMAHSLGIKVTAEGIEHEKVVTLLKALDCDYMQGYHLGKPMPVFEFQELIRSDSQVSNSDDIIALEPDW